MAEIHLGLATPEQCNSATLTVTFDTNAMTIEITKRGLGQAAALEIGLEFSKRRDNLAEPELWLQGLGRALGKTERKKVVKATREWADGDSVGAHYGFGIELFCTEEEGRSGRFRARP